MLFYKHIFMQPTNNNTFIKILLCIIAIALIFTGWQVYKSNRISTATDIAMVTEPSTPQTASPETNVATIARADVWDSVTDQDIQKIVDENKRDGMGFFDEGSQFSRQVIPDITGDSIPEIIINGVSGNSSISVVLLKSDYGVELAKQKNTNGKIYPLSLDSVGRAMYRVGYKIVPEIMGYYAFSTEPKDADGTTQKCQSLIAFSWDSNQKLFTENKSASAKYLAEFCAQIEKNNN